MVHPGTAKLLQVHPQAQLLNIDPFEHESEAYFLDISINPDGHPGG
jgi:hypothetical protein